LLQHQTNRRRVAEVDDVDSPAMDTNDDRRWMDAAGRNTGNAQLSTLASVSLTALLRCDVERQPLQQQRVRTSSSASPTSATSNTGAI